MNLCKNTGQIRLRTSSLLSSSLYIRNRRRIMSSQTGLSRRRVAAASTSNDVDDEDQNKSTRPTLATSQSTSSSFSDINAARSSHAGTALAGGSKVAYDPRDLVGSGSGGDEEGRVPKLTLLEEILLLGIKDRAVSTFLDTLCFYLGRVRSLAVGVKYDVQVEVISERQTGETILDEALRMIKTTQDGPGNGVPGEKLGVGSWVDLLSGETWNVMKIGFQLKQVRERLAKGLVDKGILRTEKRNFLLFDMATHPVADAAVKESIMTRVVSLLTAQTTTIPPNALPGGSIKGSSSSSAAQANIEFPVTRAVSLVCAAYAASVLDNALVRLGYDEREAAFSRCDDLLNEFTAWPLGSGTTAPSSRREIASGGSGPSTRELIGALVQAVKGEMAAAEWIACYSQPFLSPPPFLPSCFFLLVTFGIADRVSQVSILVGARQCQDNATQMVQRSGSAGPLETLNSVNCDHHGVKEGMETNKMTLEDAFQMETLGAIEYLWSRIELHSSLATIDWFLSTTVRPISFFPQIPLVTPNLSLN
ncbi:10795_t:CDS:2 [Acaulospora colombiana]|uniref:10795_t:CDS:1 n=1 Tax=Acaulospora colombiana TaxID=27376 RepID=A0ACA9NR31_9GLOM|nr:10795_t:CDS:2 [Acaulospora colombiana]